jgi:hypothetical protein
MGNAGITRVEVRSSTIRSIGYSEELRIMEVEFSRGDVYQFFLVPAGVYREFLASDSKGTYFGESVREKYPCEKQPYAPDENDLTAALEQSLTQTSRASSRSE